MGEHNVDAVLACSALLAPFGLAYSQIERRRIQSRQLEAHAGIEASGGMPEQDEHSQCLCQSGVVNIDLTWINLLRGIQPSVQTTEFWRVRDSAVLPLLQWSDHELEVTRQSVTPGPAMSPYLAEAAASEHPLLSAILGDGDAALAALQSHLESIRQRQDILQPPSSSGNLDVCLKSLKGLQIVTRQFTIVRAGNHRFLMAWISRLDNTFVKRLAENHIMTLAVYAHFLVYTILLDGLWWVGDLGVATIRNILEGLGIVGCRRCSSDGRLGPSTANTETSTAQESLDLQGLFAWPARVLELHERLSLEYGRTGKQRERSLPLR